VPLNESGDHTATAPRVAAESAAMPTAAVPGARLHYERAGTGTPLLQIGGTGGDLRRSPSPLEWPGAERFDQVVYDHRGLGRSVAVDPSAQPSMADFAADALALADHLGWDRFALVGVSFGGMVAQELAITGGSRLTHLVLACTSSGGAGGASEPLHEILALEPATALARMVALVDTRTAEDAALRATLAEALAPLTDPAQRPPGLALQLEARRHHDVWSRLREIVTPTLVVAGRFDALASPANARALAGAITGAELELFDGGHVFLRQDPKAWPRISAFLAGS
jgi:3-oxoadipate enol-lactonase